MNNLSLVQLINSGAHDAELDQIEQAVKLRRSAQRFSVVEGQDVWINRNCGTKYLQGRRAKIVEINRVRLVIKMVNEHQGQRFHGRITVPVDMISTTRPDYAVD